MPMLTIAHPHRVMGTLTAPRALAWHSYPRDSYPPIHYGFKPIEYQHFNEYVFFVYGQVFMG
jgi:hypothetical protein